MIVKCIDNKYSSCSKNVELMKFLELDSSDLYTSNLCLNEKYLVVAIILGPFATWFYLQDRFRGLRYPVLYPSSLFSIEQSKISRFWENGFWIDRLGKSHSILAPGTWNEIPMFYGELFEGNKETQKIYFQKVKDLSMEFPLPWIKKKAVAVGEGCWVSDESFENQWEADKAIAMTIHPQTQELVHNPLYLDGLAI